MTVENYDFLEDHLDRLMKKKNYLRQAELDQQEFCPPEHQLLGISGPSRIRIHEDYYLSYGQIMALSGDFYGNPEEIIQDAEENIRAIMRLYKIADEEEASVVDQLRHLIQNTPRYLKLAYWNFDHFRPDSVSAYKLWHQQAINIAREAYQLLGKLGEKDSLVENKVHLAYLYNAFADHFLTDSFTAGHIRVPRKELYQQSRHVVGGLRAKSMHDEDNKYGIWVKNGQGKTWLAFGDDDLTKSQEHQDFVMAAVAASLADIRNALKGEKVREDWMELIPDPLDWKKGMKPGSDEWQQQSAENPQNYEPMFYVDNDGKIIGREE